LLAFAEHQFRLSLPDKDGITERDRLEQIQEQLHKLNPDAVVPELVPPPFPDLLSHLWGYFAELAENRAPSGMGGPTRIGYRDIREWEDFFGIKLTPAEVNILKQLDTLWLKVFTEGK